MTYTYNEVHAVRSTAFKKGQIAGLQLAGLILVVVGLIVTIGLYVSRFN